MKTTYTFSIGIPAYKSTFLSECISSVINQSYDRFELIIINDCSPEPVDEIINSFQDYRIKYSKNDKNIGAENVVDNWNKCLEKATGDFFVLMGDDDVMEPNYLEEFLNLINKYPDLDVYHCRSKIIDENSKAFSLTPSCPEFESVYDCIWHRLNEHRIQFISDFVYRRSTLINNGGFYKIPLAWASDDISAFIACGSKGIAYTNAPIFNYRMSRLSISTSGNYELKLKAILFQQNWFYEFFLDSPECPNDKIIYDNLNTILRKYVLKRKVRTISAALNQNFISNILKVCMNRKKYEVSFTEIIFSIIDFTKNKTLNWKYKITSR